MSLTIRVGDTVIYDDGREGHRGVLGVVLAVDVAGMLVHFADRTEPNFILFSEPQWMDHLTVPHPVSQSSSFNP